MPYAANGIISKDTPIEGGISITESDYKQALDAKLRGDEVRVVDGVMEIYTPSRERTTYWLPPAEEHQTEPGEEPPADAVLVEPPDEYHVIEDGQWVYSLERERDTMVGNAWQVRAALHNAGLLDDVEALMADPETPRDIVLMWQFKERIRRTHPATVQMSTVLGWTDTQLDDLFRAAREIEP